VLTLRSVCAVPSVCIMPMVSVALFSRQTAEENVVMDVVSWSLCSPEEMSRHRRKYGNAHASAVQMDAVRSSHHAILSVCPFSLGRSTLLISTLRISTLRMRPMLRKARHTMRDRTCRGRRSAGLRYNGRVLVQSIVTGVESAYGRVSIVL
jgi:hypothetical protein